MAEIDLEVFLGATFEDRIRLINEAAGTRLWSDQLKAIWRGLVEHLGGLAGACPPQARQLMRELMVLAPEADTAQLVYRCWIGDNQRPPGPVPDIVYLIFSCRRERYMKKAAALYRELAAHFSPLFIVVGDEQAAESRFEGEFLTVAAPDNYEGLVSKVLAALVAVRQRFGRVAVLKIDDDDRCVAAPRQDEIVALVARTQYAGTVVGDYGLDRCWHVGKRERLGDAPYSRRSRGGWAAGPLYYLGPVAVELLVQEYLFYPGEFGGEIFGWEDKAISDALRARGIEPTQQDLSPIFGIAGPFAGGAFEDWPPPTPEIAFRIPDAGIIKI